jgi:hypothetical protein
MVMLDVTVGSHDGKIERMLFDWLLVSANMGGLLGVGYI